jgi:hypothetical protein
MGTLRSRAIETEFVIAEISVTLLSLVLLSMAALVRSQNVQMYPIITQIMAKDSIDSLTKTRWLTIVQHYYPRSLYCFTLFDISEISWLYCLKVSVEVVVTIGKQQPSLLD